MKIGVDASCWSNRRGFGRFTRELLTALVSLDNRHDYLFFADQQTVLAMGKLPANVDIVAVKTDTAPVEAASASGRRSILDLWRMSSAVAKYRIDLFFFPALYSYFPIRNRAKIAVTIYDMTPARLARSVFPNKKLEFFWNLKERMALWQADRILTISDYSKKEILEHRNVRESFISVVSAGPGAAFRVLSDEPERSTVLSKFGLKLSDRFLLHAGGLSPHKNLQMLARVFKKLMDEQEFSDLKLVFAGDFEKDSFYSDYSALRKLCKELTIQDRVVFTGYVDDFELAHIYNSATLFVFPSFQEGFGLPAVESMACGTPIVASEAGSLPEIIGDAGEFFDPSDSGTALEVIRRVLLDEQLRRQMRARGLERAKLFSWEHSAKQTLGIFDSMMSS